MRRRARSTRPFYLLALCLLLASFLASVPAVAEAKKERTYYQILELEPDATLKDVKKAYRRLAVQHHPDRNLGNEEESTIKFREISEAYEVLSDESSRRDYDNALRRGFGGGGGGGGGGGNFKWSFGEGGGGGGRRRPGERRHRDPFAQFNDVFKNDPFFADASRNLDDLFNKHFSGGGGGGGQNNNGDNAEEEGGSWIWNKVKDYMPDVKVTTSTTSNFGGRTTSSSSSHSYGGGRSRGRGGSTYTSRSTRTVIQNGQRVTIQSLEKDGNKIEEKYVGEKLIERKINGMKDDIGRIGGGAEF